jgi:hypothetical protein
VAPLPAGGGRASSAATISDWSLVIAASVVETGHADFLEGARFVLEHLKKAG